MQIALRPPWPAPLLALSSALLLVASIPPLAWSLCAWVALVPLLMLIRRAAPARAAAWSYLVGILYYAGHLWWTLQIDMMNRYNFSALILFLALFFPVFALAAGWLSRNLPGWEPASFPLAWVACEYLKTHVGFLSIPYGILGYSQFQLAPLLALAGWTGVYGVSWVLATVNAALAALVVAAQASGAPARNRSRVALAALPLALGLVLAAAASSGWHKQKGEALRVAVLQGNAIADEKTGYQRYLREVLPVYRALTEQAASAGAPFVVWPAGSIPGILPLDREGVLQAAGIARENRVHLLFGAAGVDKFSTAQLTGKRITNSSFLLTPQGSLAGRYDKIHLVPFEEYLPLEGKVNWPSWLGKPREQKNFPGRRLTVFSFDRFRFGVQICFENLFPDQVRQLVAGGAQFIVGHTNEFYAKPAAARYQNLAFTVFRAAENRVPVIRCSGNGISCIIDHAGRVVTCVRDRLGKVIDVAGFAVADLRLPPGRSFYNRFGDLFAAGCLVLTLILCAAMPLCKLKSYQGGTV